MGQWPRLQAEALHHGARHPRHDRICGGGSPGGGSLAGQVLFLIMAVVRRGGRGDHDGVAGVLGEFPPDREFTKYLPLLGPGLAGESGVSRLAHSVDHLQEHKGERKGGDGVGLRAWEVCSKRRRA